MNFLENKWKKVKKCGLSQKLKRESKTIHEHSVHQIEFYVGTPKFSQISLQITFFFKKGLTSSGTNRAVSIKFESCCFFYSDFVFYWNLTCSTDWNFLSNNFVLINEAKTLAKMCLISLYAYYFLQQISNLKFSSTSDFRLPIDTLHVNEAVLEDSLTEPVSCLVCWSSAH